jgi:hypothetical protein
MSIEQVNHFNCLRLASEATSGWTRWPRENWLLPTNSINLQSYSREVVIRDEGKMVVAEIVGESGREGEREGGGVEHWRRALQANVLWSCLAVSVLKQYFYWAHKVGDPKPRGTFHHYYIGAYRQFKKCRNIWVSIFNYHRFYHTLNFLLSHFLTSHFGYIWNYVLIWQYMIALEIENI